MMKKLGRKQLVLASLVLALGAAVYLNWQFTGANKLPIGGGETSSQLGAAQLVNNTYMETVGDDMQGSQQANAPVDAFAEARLTRQNSRDQALELLDGVLEDVNADSDAKKVAVEQASAVAQSILKETNVENLLKAKGYEECVAYIADGQCTVVISGEIQDSDGLIVQEVVMEQTGLSAETLTIIGTA